jgi:GT2 family glycosyltransferase
MLEGCIRSLRRQDYPEFEILIVDNGRDPVPTRELAERLGARYLRCRQGGLSAARNAAVAGAAHEWIAFTDDDCRPEPNWLRELVRPAQDDNCRCACGLVLPAQLENSAEITFEIYGGLGRGYAPTVFDPHFLRASRAHPAQTWRIGAGANMLLHRDFARSIGGFDLDMGPGPASVGGCGEDTDFFYQVLRHGYNVHYVPRAVVYHLHRSSPAALRRQIYGYAVGHAAYHARCLFKYGDYRSLLQLVYHLPRWFARNLKRGIDGRTKYPFSLVFLELRGTVVGPLAYAAAKARRLWRERIAKSPAAPASSPAGVATTAEPAERAAGAPLARPAQDTQNYDAVAGAKSFRAA